MKKNKIPEEKARISINIPNQLLEELDSNRKKNHYTRSTWISMAIVQKLSNDEQET